MSSYFAELVSEFIIASVVIREGREAEDKRGGASMCNTGPWISQVVFEDEAKIVGNHIWVSIKSMKGVVSRVSVVNPVWVFRTFGTDTGLIGPESTEADKLSSKCYNYHEPGPDRNDITYKALRTVTWHNYDDSELSHLRPNTTLKLMSTIAKQESIEMLSEEFDRKVGSIVMSVHKQQPTNDDKDKEEPLSYSQQVLQRLEKDSSSMVASSQIVMAELKVPT